MLVSDLLAFEKKMRDERGWKRKQFCEQLGISQAKLRRHVEAASEGADVGDRTLALACAAISAGLEPMGNADAGQS